MVSDAAGENTEIVARGETGQEGENGEDVDEPEDDYNAAWEVLDVARTIYSKIVEDLKEGEGKEERLLLAECFLALGDVSLETGELAGIGSAQHSQQRFFLVLGRKLSTSGARLYLCSWD